MSDQTRDRPSHVRLILTITALIVIGAVVSYLFLPLGVLILVATVVALVWTLVTSFRRRKDGQAFNFEGELKVFFGILGSAFVVLIASSIAFVATCFPIGLFGTNGEGANPGDDKVIKFAYVVGGLAAVIAGIAAVFFLNRIRRTGVQDQPLKKRRW